MKLVLKICVLETELSNGIFKAINKFDEQDEVTVSYSANIKSYPDFKLGHSYDAVFSRHNLKAGRLITSRKNYDLDYSYIE